MTWICGTIVHVKSNHIAIKIQVVLSHLHEIWRCSWLLEAVFSYTRKHFACQQRSAPSSKGSSSSENRCHAIKYNSSDTGLSTSHGLEVGQLALQNSRTIDHQMFSVFLLDFADTDLSCTKNTFSVQLHAGLCYSLPHLMSTYSLVCVFEIEEDEAHDSRSFEDSSL